jgi:transcriptional regulator with XRE-family HTH domain
MHQSSALVAKLKEAIKAKGLTTTALAEETGIPYGTLSTWFSGRSVLDIDKLNHRSHIEAICKTLGVSMASLEASVKEAPAEYKVSPGRNVLEILLITIENPNAPKQQREDAKNIIREWLKDVVR